MLRRAAGTDENLMPATLALVRAGGTTGEAGDEHRHQGAALYVSHADSRLDQGVPTGRDGILNEARHLELLRSMFGSGKPGQHVPDDAFYH